MPLSPCSRVTLSPHWKAGHRALLEAAEAARLSDLAELPPTLPADLLFLRSLPPLRARSCPAAGLSATRRWVPSTLSLALVSQSGCLKHSCGWQKRPDKMRCPLSTPDNRRCDSLAARSLALFSRCLRFRIGLPKTGSVGVSWCRFAGKPLLACIVALRSWQGLGLEAVEPSSGRVLTLRPAGRPKACAGGASSSGR